MRPAHTIWKVGVGALFLLTVLCVVSRAETNRGAAKKNWGAAEITLNTGGAQGKVHFPHLRHEKMAPDNCQVCHRLFPEKKNSIDLLKKAGKLRDRQVMIGLCLKCHRKTALAGKPSGPRACMGCHNNPPPRP